MRKEWILLLALLLSAPAVISLEEVSSGKYASEQTFEVDNTTYSIIFSDADTKALVESNLTSLIISNASCEALENLEFCLDGLYFTYPNRTHNYTWEAALSVWRKKAQIEIGKEIEDDTLLQGQNTEVTLHLTNRGDWEASEIVFADKYPAGIGPTLDMQGCSLSGNGYVWEGSLSPGQEHVCTYSIRGMAAMKNNSIAQASFFDGSSKKTVSLKSMVQVFQPAVKLVSVIAENTTKVGASNKLQLNLSNTNPEYKATGTLRLMFPAGTVFGARSSDVDKSGTDLTKKFSLESKEREAIFVNFSVTRSGKSPIKVLVASRVNDFSEEGTIEIPLTVVAPEPGIRFYGKERVQPGESVDFAATVYNPSSQKIKDARITTETTIPGIQPLQIILGELVGDKEIARFSFPAEKGTYTYAVQVAYSTEFGEHLLRRFEYETVVEPVAIVSENEQGAQPEAVPQEAAEAPQLLEEQGSEPAEAAETGIISAPLEPKGWTLGSKSRLFAAMNLILLGVLGVLLYLAARNPKVYK